MEEALRSMLCMYMQGMPLHFRHAGRLLQDLKLVKDLAHVRCLHSIFVSMELASSADIADHLIPLFESNESSLEASLVFCSVVEPTARTYHGIISAYAGNGDGAVSFDIYKRMPSEGIQPNEFTFPCILKVCRDNRAIEEGQLVHNQIVCLGLEAHAVIGNTLIDMYTKCGSLDMALTVFNELPDRSVVAWSTLIRGYTELGQGPHALELFQKMQQARIQPDMIILSCVLKACCMLGLVGHGKLIHDQMIRSELSLDVVAGNTLIDMYSKCGWIEEACSVFRNLVTPSLMSWGAMVAGRVQNGQGIQALADLQQMQSEGVRPDKVVYLCAVTACAGLQSLNQGRIIHNQIISNNLDSYVVIRNALIDMYTRCGKPDEGCKIFDSCKNQDAVSWATVMATHLRNGLGFSALEFFARMQRQGVKPEQASFSCVLKACGQTYAFQEGRLIHHQIICDDSETDLVVGNSLVNMYANCGSLMDACSVFDRLRNRTVVSWSAIMAGYAQHGLGFPIAEIFERMLNDNVEPDEYVFSCALKACSITCSLSEGKWIHSQLINSGVKVDAALGSTLVGMYSKCGDLEEACKVFNDLEKRDVVSWGAMIAGCVMQGNCALALRLYSEMKRKGVETNAYILSSVLKACGLIGATCQGKILHDQIIKHQLESDVFVESALIDMYVNCEHINEASKVHDTSQNWSLVSWGALVSGYARGADSKLAMDCVEQMRLQGLTPNEVIYMSILSACGHTGQVEKSQDCFNSMLESQGVSFSIKHYNCIADMYARAGHLKEASELLHSLPSQPDTYGLASLCSASSLHEWQYGPQNSMHNLDADDGSGL